MPRKLALALALTAGLVAGGGLQTASAATRRVVSPPRWVDTTGTRDVSRAMAKFLASVPDGSVVRLASRGRYRMERTLLLRGRHDLTLEGNGATIFATTRGTATRSHVRVEDSSGIVIRDLVVRGANPRAGVSEEAYDPAVEHQHGFDIRSSSDIVLENVAASDVYGDFVYLGAREDGPWTADVVVRDSRFSRNGRQGVALTAARDVLIERNYFGDVRHATFDFEPEAATAGVERVTIRDNQVGKGRLLFVAAGGSGPVHHVTIASNDLHGQALQVYVRNRSAGKRNDWTIAGNTSDLALGNPHGSAMRFWRVSGLVVRQNTQLFQSGRNMVVADVSCSGGVTVRDNVRPGSVGEARIRATC